MHVSLQQVAPGGTITGTGSPFPQSGYPSYQEPEEEPEPVRYVAPAVQDYHRGLNRCVE